MVLALSAFLSYRIFTLMTTNSSSTRLEAEPHAAKNTPQSPSGLVLISFAAVYILWGSTYFAIRVSVESIPPFLMAGLRHFTVGLVFYPLFQAPFPREADPGSVANRHRYRLPPAPRRQWRRLLGREDHSVWYRRSLGRYGLSVDGSD